MPRWGRGDVRRLILLAFIAALGVLGTQQAARADSADIRVEAVIWQFGRDYPGADPNDVNLPVKTVYIKTHDGTDWMSKYDSNPNAVSGPDALRKLIQDYSYQGVDVVAWFVPYGTDIEGQLQRAREVIDTGVKGLIADVEPYSGFCNANCGMLAEQFWKPLRAQRPNANLGVTYDPRTGALGKGAISAWLSVADMAAPECYWETFAGQGVWGGPGTCLLQAHADLEAMTPGRNVEFAPMLQGATSGASMRVALDTALYLGAERVSLWRRGVVPAEVWNEIKAYVGEIDRPCWVIRSDNCLIQEPGKPVWLMQGGARFLISDPDTLFALGFTFNDIHGVPAGFMDLVPLVPADGTLLKELGLDTIYVVYAGAQFGVPGPGAFDSIGLDWGAVRYVPPGGMAQIATRPADYNRFRELNGAGQFIIVKGQKLALDAVLLDSLLKAGRGAQMYTLWDGALDAFPDVILLRGDATCDGAVNAVDALRILQTIAGIQNLGICAGRVGNVDCDNDSDAIDALLILRWIAGVGDETPTPSPSPSPEPTPTSTPTSTPDPSSSPDPTETPRPKPARFPTPTVMPTPVPQGVAVGLADAPPAPDPTPQQPTACPAIGSAATP